ncbi:MAG: type I restriction enzyme HsdR N-terminal domain-containing protein [Bacteroidales bacterium]|jgi:hypothetical protein|nr:type I restriction enzyme HsdR N-terminal domain-containing protein [Bacteroidales bacterium]
MQKLNFPSYQFRIEVVDNKEYIWDEFRKTMVRLTPEEWVRQHMLKWLNVEKKYPASIIGVEKKILVNKMDKRFDALVFDSNANPHIIIECKAPEVKLNSETFLQLANYNSVVKAPYLMITNGIEHYCAFVDFEKMKIKHVEDIPTYESNKNK